MTDATNTLCNEIFALLTKHQASTVVGASALGNCFLLTLITSGASKEDAMRVIARHWDNIEPSLLEKWKDFTDARRPHH